MKILLASLVLVSNVSLAGVEEIRNLFENEKKFGSHGEAKLTSEIVTSSGHLELSKILANKISGYSGLESIKTLERSEVGAEYFKKKVMQALINNGQYAPFFCDYFEENWDWDVTERCEKSVSKIADALIADKDIDSVYLVEVSGNYYGDWSAAYLIGLDYDKRKGLVLDFDLLHEI